MDRGQFGNVYTCAAANGARAYFAIIRFLGYNPLPTAKTLAEQLVRQRMTLGLSQKEAAREIGLDQGTLAKCGRGEREPTGAFLGRVKSFLDQEETQNSQSRHVGHRRRGNASKI